MALGLIAALGTPAIARETWSQVSSIQILEGPDEIRVFVEVERITSFDDEVIAHLMSTHPRVERVSQTVFTIDPRGKVTEQAVATKAGPTFHPNLGRIFRCPGGFYLYGFPSLDRPASLYQWREDHFERLGASESDEVRKAIAPFERLEPLVRVIDGLDGLSAKTGWRCMAEEACMFSTDAQPFASARHHIKIRVEMGKAPAGILRTSELIAETTSEAEPWSRTLIKVDTKKEKGRHRLGRTKDETGRP